MPRGPRGEKRPADVIGAAVMVVRVRHGDRTRGGKLANLKICPTADRSCFQYSLRPPLPGGGGVRLFFFFGPYTRLCR
jgi:hypothetical protein